MSADKKVVLGQFGATHGIKGFIKINSFTEPRKNIFDYESWFIGNDGNWAEIKVADKHTRGSKLLARLEACESPEQAEQYKAKYIAIDREHLPKLAHDEYYWADLEGCQVFNPEDELLGEVDHLMETGSNDVLVIQGKGEDTLIPFIQGDVVKHVDILAKKIVVDWDKEF